MKLRRRVLFGAVLLPVLFSAGCAPSRYYARLDSAVMAGRYADGVALADEKEYGQSSRVLYFMDRGALLQASGEYALSNEALEQAERLIEQLYTKSVSAEAGALLSNDMTLAYEGEDLEQVMVNVLKALNFLYLGDWQGAQVEARRVNERLNKLSDKYGEKAIYAEDAFARYIAGIAWEAGRGYNDAFIDYRKALQAYGRYEKNFGTTAPPSLFQDIWAAGHRLGMVEEAREAMGDRDVSLLTVPPKKRSSRELICVVYDGLVPAKVSKEIIANISDRNGHPYALAVAFPSFVVRPPRVLSVEVSSSGALLGKGSVAEDLAAIAVQNLEQRIGLISVKTFARATAKFLAAQELRDRAKGNAVLSLLTDLGTNIYTIASEQADTRSWRVLPSRFHLVRVTVPEETDAVTIRVETADGSVRFQEVSGLSALRPGAFKIVPVFVFH